MNLNKQMTTKQSIIFVIMITIALFITMQAVKAYGQNSSSSMVDKLIEDTKKQIDTEKSYRAELINRLGNSTCSDQLYERGGILILNHTTISDLEDMIKQCVIWGIIK